MTKRENRAAYERSHRQVYGDTQRKNERNYHARHKNDPEYRRRRKGYALKRKYGIGLDEYEAMLAEQGGCCAICNGEYGRELHVDHDHKTGQVRGLLCNGCNVGLGGFRDCIENLKNAICYLKRMS